MEQKNTENSFNQDQKEAINYTKGALLVLAGAGSGKTKVLTHRIAEIIKEGAPAHTILAITFTNKAADEMKERVLNLLGEKREEASNAAWSERMPWIGTFHALGAYILRNEARHAGLIKNFTILDEEDALAVIKEAEKELYIDPKQFQPARIRGLISQKKGELADRQTFGQEAAGHYFLQKLYHIWELYETKIDKNKAVDFDDLLLKTVTLFKEHPDILQKYQERWRYIHIDEYQDTNHAQYIIANMLAQRHKNICVVGDIDQCIYSWRGADFRNILAFERDWENLKTVILEENYRSTQTILDAANAVINKNKERKPKNLFTVKKGGEKISFFMATDETHEARFIAQKTQTLLQGGISAREIAVLFRTNFQSRVLEEAFLELEIPYRVSGVKFFNRKEIKDVLSYSRVALNENDLISLKRIMNVPLRGIGKTLAAKIIAKKILVKNEARKAENLANAISEVKSALYELPTSPALKAIMHKTGYWDLWDPETEEGEMRLSNLKELITLALRYDSLTPPEGMTRLLEEASLMSDQDTFKDKRNVVNLMTVHAAKGLEFDYLFISGLEDGLFPHTTLSDEENRNEEERRLFYVALTRARKKVFVSFALFRTIFGEKRVNNPSRFLADIPEHLIESLDKNISEKTIYLG